MSIIKLEKLKEKFNSESYIFSYPEEIFNQILVDNENDDELKKNVLEIINDLENFIDFLLNITE